MSESRFARSIALTWLLRIAAVIVLIMGTFNAVSAVPDRRSGIIVIAMAVLWAVVRAYRSNEDAVAWFSIVIGLNTPPFCELHIERDPWSLIAGMMLFFELVRGDALTLKRSNVRTILIFSVFCLWCLVVAGGSVYPHAALKQAVLLCFYALFMLSGLMLFSKTEKLKIVEDLLIAIIWSHLLFAFSSAAVRIAHLGFMDGFAFRWFVYGRHPNYVIFPLVLGIPLLIHFYSSSTSIIRRIASLGAIAGSLLYLMSGSYSRTGLVVLGTYSLILLNRLIRRTNMRVVVISVGLLAVFLAILLTFSVSLRGRLLSLAYPENDARLRAWAAFIELAKERPIAGYGLGTNRYIYPQAWAAINPLEPPTRQFLVEAHNAYLDILVGSGLTGLLLFLWFLFDLVFSNSRPANKNLLTTRLLGIGLIIDLLFNFRFHAHDTGTWMILFVILVRVLSSNPEERPVTIRIRYLRVPAMIIIILAMMPYAGDWCVQKAKAKLSGGDWSSIRSWFKAAAILEPLNAHPRYFLSLCSEQTGQAANALHEMRAAVALCPNYAFYRHILAQTLMRSGQLDAALAEAESAVMLEPFQSESEYRRTAAMLNQMTGNRNRAEMHSSIGVSINPKIAEEPFFLDPRSVDMKKLIRENFAFIEYLVSFREHPENLFNVAPALFRSFEPVIPPDEMIRLYRIAEDGLKSPDVFIEEAGYLIRLGRYDEAEKTLYRAIERNGEWSTFLHHLAYIALKRDDPDMAKFLADKGNRNWQHFSIDNIIGYQLMEVILTRLGRKEECEDYRRKIAWLQSGELDRQKRDLTIHTGGRDSALYDLDKVFLRDH